MLKRISQKWNAGGEPGRSLVAWSAVGVAAATISDAGLVACVAAVTAGATLALLGIRTWPALLVPVAVAGLADPEMLPWAVAGAALASRSLPSGVASRLDGDLQRQLMRSRRREEPAQVLLVSAPNPTASQLDRLVDAMRATDGLEVVVDGGMCELRAVLDGAEVDRDAVERRIWTAAGSLDLRFGWAAFPTDGAAVDTLLATARAAIESGAGVPDRPLARVGAPAPSMAEANA
jgi:hypothetical protein